MIQHRISGRYTFAARFLVRTDSGTHDNSVGANNDGHRLSHCKCPTNPAPMIAIVLQPVSNFRWNCLRGRAKRRLGT